MPAMTMAGKTQSGSPGEQPSDFRHTRQPNFG